MQQFNVGVIRPVECLQEGWNLIKDQYWLFFGITIVGMIIGGAVPFGIILGAMMCGIYYSLLQKINGQRVTFDMLFKGFDYLVPSLIVTLFIIIPAFFAGILLYVPMIGLQIYIQNSRGRVDPEVVFPVFIGMMTGFAVFMVILACVHALIMFAYPLIVERRLSGMEALKLSARAVFKNLGGIVGLILCEFVLGLIGYMIFCIGVYFVVPIMFAGVLVAYRKVFPPVNQPFGTNYTAPPPPPQFGTRA